MKNSIIVFAFLLLGIISRAQNIAYAVSIPGKELNEAFKANSGKKVIVLNFETQQSKDFIVNGLVYGKWGKKFPLLNLQQLNDTLMLKLDSFPYVFSSLKWRKKIDAPNMTIEDHKTYYFYPNWFYNSIQKKYYVIYQFSELDPQKLLDKAAGISYEEFNNKDVSGKAKIMRKIYEFLLANGGNFNPIPPKLVP